jgi:signal transduction histidine kinase
MMEVIENLSSREISSRISHFRNLGNLSEAISLCKEAEIRFPDDYFYPKIAGDLYFQKEDYEAASKSFIDFLKKAPSTPLLFNDFARRYFRLKRVWPQEKISKYAALIISEIQQGYFSQQTAIRARTLIKSDLPKKIEISPEGQKFIALSSSDSHFADWVKQTQKLELENPVELEFLLDQHILHRERTVKTFQIDTHCISIYEKMGRYENAVKIAEELLALRLHGVALRSFFRICREMGNYERADKILAKYPAILNNSEFNVLYELVYYFEAKNNFDEVQATLKRMEKNAIDSIPIQRTARNFYLRFGLLEDANRVENNISKLYAKGRKVSQEYLDEVQESETGLGSKIKELYSELEHQKQLAAISDLTTGISHELGQPITNIRYTVQFYQRLFKKTITKEMVFKVFDSILEETERMGGLIKRLSPITSSRSVIENFDLIERINKRVKAEDTRLREWEIMVNVYPKKPVYLVGDPVKFDQLISNLLLNSIDAIKEKQNRRPNRIDIQVGEERGNVNIIFSDTGVGIPAKNRGKIFDPFFSTKAPGKGEGLGLFIVWNILKMQGGKIELDPKYKNGARFLITIPKEAQDGKEG